MLRQSVKWYLCGNGPFDNIRNYTLEGFSKGAIVGGFAGAGGGCPSGRCCFLWVCGPRDTCIPVPFWNDPQAFSFRFECAVWHRLRELCGMISELNNPRTQRAKGRSRAESRALAEGQF